MDNGVLAQIITGGLVVLSLFFSLTVFVKKAKEVSELVSSVVDAISDLKITAEELADIKAKLAAVLKKAK